MFELKTINAKEVNVCTQIYILIIEHPEKHEYEFFMERRGFSSIMPLFKVPVNQIKNEKQLLDLALEAYPRYWKDFKHKIIDQY